MSIDSISSINLPQSSELQHSFSLVLKYDLGDIGYFPYLCFDYIEHHDIHSYKVLTSYLEVTVFNSYLDGFRFLGYKNDLKGKPFSLERLFQKITGRDMWNKWIHDRTFIITGEEYYISGDTVNESNFLIFSSFLYAYSNNKYFAVLDEDNGEKTCHLYIRNIGMSNGQIMENVVESNSENNNNSNPVSTEIGINVSAPNNKSSDTVDVFISYSRQDIQFVRRFLSMFKEHGINVWIDIDGIYSGDAFKKVITKAIKASTVFLFFSSKSSNVSDWTAKEINLAVRFKKNIIPILIDKSEYNDEVVFDLAGLDYIDYSKCSESSLLDERLIKSIKKYI